MLELIQSFDEFALRWITEYLRTDWLNSFVVFYTSLGNGGMIFIAISAMLILSRRTRLAGASAGVAMTLGLLVTNLILKPLVSRARPWIVMEGLETLVTIWDMNSFPSGHSTAAFAFGAALWVSFPQKWVKATVLISVALMAFSRLYVGVHFPSDVLGGILVGTVCGLLSRRIIEKIIAWYHGRKAAK